MGDGTVVVFDAESVVEEVMVVRKKRVEKWILLFLKLNGVLDLIYKDLNISSIDDLSKLIIDELGCENTKNFYSNYMNNIYEVLPYAWDKFDDNIDDASFSDKIDSVYEKFK